MKSANLKSYVDLSELQEAMQERDILSKKIISLAKDIEAAYNDVSNHMQFVCKSCEKGRYHCSRVKTLQENEQVTTLLSEKEAVSLAKKGDMSAKFIACVYSLEKVISDMNAVCDTSNTKMGQVHMIAKSAFISMNADDESLKKIAYEINEALHILHAFEPIVANISEHISQLVQQEHPIETLTQIHLAIEKIEELLVVVQGSMTCLRTHAVHLRELSKEIKKK